MQIILSTPSGELSGTVKISKIISIGASEFSSDEEKSFLYIILSNHQKILTDGNVIYDVSSYSKVLKCFNMGSLTCAVVEKIASIYLIDLQNNEILFESDDNVELSKNDDTTLVVTLENTKKALYNIENKKLFTAPDEYNFYQNSGNFYVFEENQGQYRSSYTSNKCIFDKDGNIVCKDLVGDVTTYGNYMITTKEKSLSHEVRNEESDGSDHRKNLEIEIIHHNPDDNSTSLVTLNRNSIEDMLTNPIYHDGQIIIITKGAVRFYDLDFKPIDQIEIPQLQQLEDYQKICDVLKLCFPYGTDDNNNHHMFINLKNRKFIIDYRIEGFEYWKPTFFVAESLPDENSENPEVKTFIFYNQAFEKTCTVRGISYRNSGVSTPHLFSVYTKDSNNVLLVDAEAGTITKSSYSAPEYLSKNNELGLAYNSASGCYDVLDNDLNVISTGIDPKIFGFFPDLAKIFVIGDYIGINAIVIDCDRTYKKAVIQIRDGAIIHNSFGQLSACGIFFQIHHNPYEESIFFNTATGEIQDLSLKADTGKHNLIDFSKCNPREIWTFFENSQACLPDCQKGNKQKQLSISMKV